MGDKRDSMQPMWVPRAGGEIKECKRTSEGQKKETATRQAGEPSTKRRGERCSQQLQRLVPQGRSNSFVLSLAEESSPCTAASPFFHLTLFWDLADLFH